jgi:hypothetical protein
MSATDKPKTFTELPKQQSTLGHSEFLTPSEIESLRQDLKESAAHMDKRLKSQTKKLD